MINKKILSIIIVVVVIAAGIGTYEVLNNEGYINPGIHINSFTSTSNSMVNSSLDIPLFEAHVDSSKTAEYEVFSNNVMLFSGPVTGKETLRFPSTLSQIGDLGSALCSVGLHKITLKIVYNSFSTSKSIDIFTFPAVSLSAEHSHIDTGISDTITASTSNYNITINANGQSHSGKSLTITPETAGILPVSFSMSYGSFKYSAHAGNITVYNHPEALNIYASNVTYTSGFYPTTSFDIQMTSSGGDTYSGLSYYIYLNDSCYISISSSSHSASYFIDEYGSGPYTLYFVVKDNYYSSTSKTITVYS